MHRVELQHVKLMTVNVRTLLVEELRARNLNPDNDPDERQQHGRRNQEHERRNDVEQTLD